MNDEQIAIFDYLNDNALGYQNKKSSTEIRVSLNLESGGVTNEHVRDLIRDMILNHSCLIGSCSRGYWIIQNKQELQQVCDSLENRANAVRDRANALRTSWEGENG
jgi:hypothetical protein